MGSKEIGFCQILELSSLFRLLGLKNRLLGVGCFVFLFFVSHGLWVRKCRIIVTFEVLGVQDLELSSLLGFQGDKILSKCRIVVTFEVLSVQKVELSSLLGFQGDRIVSNCGIVVTFLPFGARKSASWSGLFRCDFFLFAWLLGTKM